MAAVNRKVVLAKPLEGIPQTDHFRVIEGPPPEPGDGQFLVRHIYLSLDPYQRSAMSGRHMSADGALGANEAPNAETVGQIMVSRHPDFPEGAFVRHFGGWQEYSVCDGSKAYLVDPAVAPISTYLGVLGMPGLTAYASIIKLAEVKAGQTVLVSAASGPVGSTLGQIAINMGARAVGIAGSDEKCAYVVDELGFAACVNYKKDSYSDDLKAACPDGYDIYHDNVGGQMLNDAIGVLRLYGTVILCGLMSQYNESDRKPDIYLGPTIGKRAVMKGLVVYDYEDQRQEFLDLVAPWIADGRMKYKEDRAEGIDGVAAHFSKLMSGRNFGKSLVVLAPETA